MALIAIALLLVGSRIVGLAWTEVAVEGEWRAFAESEANLRLADASIPAGDYLRTEICARAGFPLGTWRGTRVRLLDPATGHTRVEGTIGSELVPVGADGSPECLRFSEGPVPEAQSFALELASPTEGRAPIGASVRGRFLGRSPLGDGDLAAIASLLLGSLVLIGVLSLRVAPAEGGDSGEHGWARGGSAVALFVALSVAISALMPRGAPFGLVGGVVLAVLEVALAFAIVRPAPGRDRLEALAIGRPSEVLRASLWLAAAPVIAIVLVRATNVLIALFPSRGDSPIEMMVSWSSGLLSFAALALVAPIAEEVFFRGLVYGALAGRGGMERKVLAALGAWSIFVLAHVPQDWGNWGGLASVALAGMAFTVLRALSGSTLVAALTHLTYNGLHAAAILVAGSQP